MECFQLTTPRKGEICNACVLLVKRFKRLPAGSNRHWGHVVDARVGPGLKSMTKFKKRKEEQKEPPLITTTTKNSTTNNSTSNNSNSNGNNHKSGLSMPERFCKIFKKTKKKQPSGKSTNNLQQNNKKEQLRDDENSGSSDTESSPDSPMSSISDADSTNNGIIITERDTLMKPPMKFKRKNYNLIKNRRTLDECNLVDTEFWDKKLTCCGVVYEYPTYNAVIVSMELYTPCGEHLLAQKRINGVGDLENELNGNCNTDDLLIKLTDEQIQENIENASLSGFNKISKEVFNTNTTAVKKHHLYSKRQAQQQQNSLDEKKTDMKYPLQSNVIVQPPSKMLCNNDEVENSNGKLNKDNLLHKIKSDGKITKNQADKFAALKLKTLDFNMKNLVKLCTDKNAKPKMNGNENGTKIVNGKFMSDNSSDSGYEEAHDAQQQQVRIFFFFLLKGFELPSSKNRNI